jgi:RecB family exonuclease
MCGQEEIDIRVARATRRSVARKPELVNPEAREELAKRQVFSVSEIETYLACPLRWFYERVVSPRQLDYEFDARSRGRLAHEMLRATYELLMSELPEGRVTPANLPRALALAEDALSAVVAREPSARNLEERQVRSELGRAVARLVEMDAMQLPGSFRPALLEWAFGGEEGVDFGDFKLRGRIDRVDTDGRHAVVIDYKTGAVHARAKLLDSGRVQAALYAEAVRLERGLEPVGSLYWPLKGGKPRGMIDSECLKSAGFTSTDCGDAALMRGDIEAAVHAASEAVAGMRAGDLGPRPLEGACDWCSATALCARCLR